MGFGSTSISTALLQYELDSTIDELGEVKKEEDVINAYKMCQKALKEVEEIINEYGNNSEYIKRDTLLYSAKKDDVKEIISEYEKRKENGLDVEFLDNTQKIFPFDLEAGIISKKGGAEINPYLFMQQLLDISIKKGLEVYENTKVEDILYEENSVKIVTSYGNEIKAKKVIIATGYDVDEFSDRNFGTKSITFNVVTEELQHMEEYNNYLIRDKNEPYNYYRKTTDDRIIAGGEDLDVNTNNYSEEKANEKYKILEQRLKTLFPNSKNSKIEYMYRGIFESTPDDLGYIGEDKKHPNKWYCLGYGANRYTLCNTSEQ